MQGERNITKSELEQLGLPADLFIQKGYLVEVEPEAESDFVIVRYNEAMGYIVSKECLANNKYRPGSENWHRFNNGIPPVVKKEEPKAGPITEKRFSVEDIKTLLFEVGLYKGRNSFLNNLGNRVIESALSELV